MGDGKSTIATVLNILKKQGEQLTKSVNSAEVQTDYTIHCESQTQTDNVGAIDLEVIREHTEESNDNNQVEDL